MKKKIMAAALTLVMAVTMLSGAAKEAKAALSNLVVADSEVLQTVLTPGTETKVKIPVKARTEYVYSPVFELEAPENAPFTLSEVTLSKELPTNGRVDINGYEDTYVEFTIYTKETAKIGKYPIHITYVDYFYDGEVVSGDPGITLNAEVKQEKMPAELSISDIRFADTLKPDTKTTISFTVKNEGELTALNTYLTINYSGTTVIPEYTNYNMKLGDLAPGASKKVTAKVHILEGTNQNIIELPIGLTYKDSDGTELSGNSNNKLYLPIELPAEIKDDGTIVVNGVSQSVDKPRAGEKVTVTFHLENTSSRDYTDVKLYPSYVPGTGFEPVNAEPYQYVGTVKAGERKQVSVSVIAGENISEGMNTLDVGYSYVTVTGEEKTDKVSLYVLHVVGKQEESAASKPKLMVSDFTTSVEEVKAGEVFDFTFSVLNTHSSVAAKNIKVTVTSQTFSVTSGSNSFFIQGIEPGEKQDLTINLKASAAATTGSYALNISMEYEYDGMPTTAEYADGVKVTEEKMLTVKENLRVSVENISAGNWDMPIINQTTSLSFELYNMGKSQLNNVYFTLEGGFAIANGSSYYYGNLQAGYPDYVEVSVIPLESGSVSGVLIIHMEDSNGDEVEYRKEFNCAVQEEQTIDWGNTGSDDIYMPDIPTVTPDVAKEPLLPLWAFIAVQVGVLLVGTFLTRKLVLSSYRRKLRRKEEE